MLGRFLQPLPLGTSRRAYSFFSSKPGGGRYFNSAKPHKVTPASATASATAKAKARPDDGSPSSPSSSASASDEAPSKALGHEDATPAVPSQSQPSAFSSESSPSPVPRLPPHPTFSRHTYPLHHFFSLHRPLLLVPLATSTLFESPSASFDQATSPSPPEVAASPFDDMPDTPADADADAARQLARALALNRVGGWIDWEQTLARLGDADSIRALESSSAVEGTGVGVNLDSTKRKKRKKMSKHK
jgi:hypothetical protein